MEKEPSIIYQQNKKTGVVYVYENHPFWDSEKKQSRSTRKLLGKLDPSTGDIVTTRGRNAKEPIDEMPASQIDSRQIIQKILTFFQLFMCGTLAKRLLSMALIAIGVSDNLIMELTGLCGQSVRTLKKSLAGGDIDSLFHVGGGGRKRKLVDVEDSIIKEINSNNYHSHQQIADMIQEKYGIKVSLPVISRLLKKTGSNG
jgi:transposase